MSLTPKAEYALSLFRSKPESEDALALALLAAAAAQGASTDNIDGVSKMAAILADHLSAHFGMTVDEFAKLSCECGSLMMKLQESGEENE